MRRPALESHRPARPAGLRWGAMLALPLLAVLVASAARAEDGYDLWLRYRPLPAEQIRSHLPRVTQLLADAATPTRAAARAELLRGLAGLMGQAPPIAQRISRNGAIILGTPASSPLL